MIMLLILLTGILLMAAAWAYMEHQYEDSFEHITLERAHCGQCGQYKDLVNGHCVTGC